ncbi:MAG: FAD-dependent oxidoreductase, partial [Halobacteria archaeon]|nr:FAD-dependent oxidoreductase [Halobacteria archaeon]
NRCRPPDDGDIAVPYRDNIILGTTSVEVESADSYSKTDEEIEVVVEECAAMLPSVSHDDVERVYWGVRPLYGGSDESGRRISRDFHLLDHSERDGVKNFTTIVGGKLTTYRRMAEEVSDHICDKLGVEAECRTRDELPADDSELLDSYINEVVYDCSADTL